MPTGLAVSVCVAMGSVARTCWTRLCGRMPAPCCRTRNVCAANTRVDVRGRNEKAADPANKSAS
jgi:hypothetical protein